MGEGKAYNLESILMKFSFGDVKRRVEVLS